MWDDEPTRPRLDSFVMAQTELALGEILRALSVPALPVEAEREIREVLDGLVKRARRQSHAAVRVASEAETDAHNERLRRELLERRLADVDLELAASGLREKALKQELDALRSEIQSGRRD